MADYIVVQEFDARCRVGCTPEERSYPQRLALNLAIEIDSRISARSGDLGDTVCYHVLCNALTEFFDRGEWPLIEQLGEDIAKFVLEQFPAAIRCDLEIRKFILSGTAWVGLKISRTRLI